MNHTVTMVLELDEIIAEQLRSYLLPDGSVWLSPTGEDDLFAARIQHFGQLPDHQGDFDYGTA